MVELVLGDDTAPTKRRSSSKAWKIKTFVGTSENALHIQIWTALIAILMLRFLQLFSTWGWSMSNLVAMIRLNLFTYRDLHKWLDAPFTPPDVGLSDLQLALAV